MKIDPFGQIDGENLEEYYQGELQIYDHDVAVDLNFESESIKKSDLDDVKKNIEEIQVFADKAFDAISKDYDLGEDSEAARIYLEHHLDEFTEDEMMEVFGTKDVDKQTFFNALSINRVGFFPEDGEIPIIFDIQLPREFTDYLIAVTFDSVGEVSYLSMES